MQVILLERVDKLGLMGDVVSVKPGFARNYLLPKKKALRATKENLARFEGERGQLEAANLTLRTEAEAVGTRLDGLSLVMLRQASEGGQLYGSVTARDIAVAVSEAGFTVERRQIKLEATIKTLGIHRVRVALHPEVAVGIAVNVARSESEAEAQAAGETAPPDVEGYFEDAELAAQAEASARAAGDEGSAEPEGDPGAQGPAAEEPPVVAAEGS